MTGRLGLQTLVQLPPEISRPTYDPARVRSGILHLGAGAFHRAHQAVYTDDLLNAGDDFDWGIVAVSMRRPGVAEALRRQQGLYSLTDYDTKGTGSLRVIGAIREALVLAAQPAAVAVAIARSEIRVVTLTVTEKAYYRDESGAGLDLGVQAVRDDLASHQPTATAVGALVAGLERRRAAKGGPLSVVCCDNLPDNGVVLRRLCLDFAREWKPGLEAWIDTNVRFPSSMVDRITPATTPELISEAEARLGCRDEIPIACEAFRQWVIEDDFAAGRPGWDVGGAQFVSDVRPFERMKLRMLNASHSALAYLGLLGGRKHVHEALAVPEYRVFVDHLMRHELAPTLSGLSPTELQDYRRALLQRFSSPRPPHRLAQIAEDGSQKMPIRVLDPLRERLAAAQPCDRLVLVVAAWLRFHELIAQGELPGPLVDPLADRLLAVVSLRRLSERVQALGSVFGEDLVARREFLVRLDQWQGRLAENRTEVSLGRAGHGG